MEMVKSLGMTLVDCPGLKSIYHILLDFQLNVKSDSIPLLDICAKTAKCYTDIFGSSDSNLIINMYCSGERASQIGEFINSLQFLSIHSDGWFTVRLSTCWLVYYLSHFCAYCKIKVVIRL